MSKNLRIIHLLAIVLALTAFARPASGQTVSVSVKGVPLKDAIPMIERQTGYNFFYSTALPDMESPVTVELKDKTIAQVLEAVFSGLQHRISGPGEQTDRPDTETDEGKTSSSDGAGRHYGRFGGACDRGHGAGRRDQ